jgi:FtsP/CotA-like multicopper oxidase with cupredoxin domain
MKQITGIIFLAVLIVGASYLLYTNNYVRNNTGGKINNTGSMMRRPSNLSGSNFSTDVSGLPDAISSQVVELKNGQTYELKAEIVKKKIGTNEIKMLAYNRMIPGPLLKVQKGSTITIKFINNTDVESTLHSHGVRLDNKFDGAPGLTQETVKPGGSFTYTVKFPDTGLFWYHPHVREDYAQELGLYGNYMVAPNTADYLPQVNREVPLVLDDILIKDGKIASFDTGAADNTLMGRFGNTMLINGEPDYILQVKQGEVVRFYITNVANTRIFNFAVSGQNLKAVAGDASKYERDLYSNDIIIGPSERQIVDVFFEKPGTYEIQNKTPNKTYTLGKVTVSEESVGTSYKEGFITPRTNMDVISDIDRYRNYFDKKPDKNLILTLQMKHGAMGGMNSNSGMMGNTGSMSGMGGHMMGMGNDPGAIEWEDDMSMMNAMSNAENVKWIMRDKDTGKENTDIDWKFKKGDVVKISIFNDPNSMHPMQHPIHFHGQRFLVLSIDGVPNDNLVWKDTFIVGKGQTAQILVDMSNPGEWMAHCHIAEHLEANMMMKYSVQ